MATVKIEGKTKARLDKIRGRIKDLYKQHPHEIKTNKFLYLAASTVSETKFVLDLLDAVMKTQVQPEIVRRAPEIEDDDVDDADNEEDVDEGEDPVEEDDDPAA